MFTWILQEREILPDNALWDQGRLPSKAYEVHGHIEWLLAKVLGTPKRDRQRVESDDWKEGLNRSVPFLNGSLFTALSSAERPRRLSNGMYLAEDGLLSILRRYDWTLCDRTGYQSETALDPSMLGEMFEQLMLKTEGARLEGGTQQRKMPGGTYYTPQDVADEMTADAIAGWLSRRVSRIEWGHARELVHPIAAGDGWRRWDTSTKRDVARLLTDVTVFDPCCGSGVFTLAMLHGLWRALRRLRSGRTAPRDMEFIIERQLYAADIHPMAVLITRLRLFIALIDARLRHGSSGATLTVPLPNLETRCIAANTLSVDVAGQDVLRDADWDRRMDDLRAAREMWTVAHYPEDKATALEEESQARHRLKVLGGSWIVPDELKWLDLDFLSITNRPADQDVRKLFPAPHGGWDIVIGNPPYQRPDEEDKHHGSKLGYTAAKSNLYLMFIEAALKVVRPGGCVTLVVPHSIVFRRDSTHANVRKQIESMADRIDIRTYDNMPQPLFPRLPWLKKPEHGIQNRQRATIVSVRIGANADEPTTTPNQGGRVLSRGLIRLSASNRSSVLKSALEGQEQCRWTVQWTQAPTAELAELLRAMRLDIRATTPQVHGQTATVTFPPTAMYFISCLPESALQNPLRKKHLLRRDLDYWPWTGLYNSHLFHAYWLMVGDAFHVTMQDYGTIRRPPGWADDAIRKKTEMLARRLIDSDTLDACRVVKSNRGPQHNVNFHKAGAPGPAIVGELDGILLDAYGLPHDPLMEQMRIIRKGGAHALRLGRS